MKTEVKLEVLAALAVIGAQRDEIRDRCAPTTVQRIDAAVTEITSLVNDSEESEAAPQGEQAAPPVVDVKALGAEVAALVAPVLADAVVAWMEKPTETGG